MVRDKEHIYAIFQVEEGRSRVELGVETSSSRQMKETFRVKQ